MRADARRNRERIIAAAREVFAESGRDAQMDDVADRAGVGVGTVYRHFASKDVLIGELLTQKFTAIIGLMQEAKAEGGEPGEALLGCLGHCAATMEQDAATQAVLSGPQPTAVWTAAAPTMRRLNAISDEMISAGQASGTLRDDLKVTDIRLMMGGIAATMSDPTLAPLWRRHLQLMLDGMRAPAARGASTS
jgi:AcrR family transcriptional regulator